MTAAKASLQESIAKQRKALTTMMKTPVTQVAQACVVV